MKISKIVLLIFAMTLWYSSTFAWSYPIKEISKVECKFSPWSEHSDDCKITLPRIENADYNKYKKNVTMRLMYSVLWWSTYTNGWDVWYWSHLWVDIATAQWTPIYAMWAWTVIIAWTLSWRWKTVVIKHTIWSSNIYSAYAHMSNINTTKWSTVKEWEKIWEVWHTWNSWGNHLHFQIDINEKWSHPYYYSQCAGKSEDVVNKWLCREHLLGNTIDPISFIENNWEIAQIIKNIDNTEEIKKINTEEQKEKQINPTEIVSRQELMMTELQLFLARYNLTGKSNIPSNLLYKWDSGQIMLNVRDSGRNKPFNWVLPQEIEVSYDPKIISVLPKALTYIEKWERPIQIKALKEWTTQINLKFNWKILKSFDIRVANDRWTIVEWNKAWIYAFWKFVTWGEYWWAAIMKDSFLKNIISVKYNWTFTLKVTGNAKLCSMKLNMSDAGALNKLTNMKCENLVDSVDYNYSNTLKWIFIFKIIPTWTEKIKLEILKDWKVIWTQYVLSIKEPSDVKKNITYYTQISEWIKKLYFRIDTRNWKFLSTTNIKESDATYWIKNIFPKAQSKAWSNYKYPTRLEFLKLISELIWIKSKNTKVWFRDVSDKNSFPYTNILIDYDIKFQDQFWKNYLQPNKKITRWEAAYILSKLKEKIK